MSNKILAVLGILVGGITTILALFNAFGVDLTEDQQKAIAGVAGILLMVVSAWLHPNIPVGNGGEE
jgi:hypothetical protein